MTRRELRENTFKMLFRVEFHKAEEIPEQFTLFEEEIAGLSDEDRAYLTDKCNHIFAKIEECSDQRSVGKLEDESYGQGGSYFDPSCSI